MKKDIIDRITLLLEEHADAYFDAQERLEDYKIELRELNEKQLSYERELKKLEKLPRPEDWDVLFDALFDAIDELDERIYATRDAINAAYGEMADIEDNLDEVRLILLQR